MARMKPETDYYVTKPPTYSHGQPLIEGLAEGDVVRLARTHSGTVDGEGDVLVHKGTGRATWYVAFDCLSEVMPHEDEPSVTVGALNEAAGLLELDDLDLEVLRKVIRIAERLDKGAA
ncbi:hypothetical protein SEA_BAILEYBLU_39 [Arthrobacter phage BaileyBlu]|uniref:Uncharacterized protein n=1 Tax=Arthrobacter phage BaileyBlu TaxID=2910754 RepID=A0AA49GYW5_9CAUD|nr:hypothetical protein PQD78_gp39 [Arthrobacter phage BaileyBlu]UJQ87177.1 hypothetical protein SEA_BAILEYBLU_39 [Arthrobacter phage BaileyBlu]